MMNSFSSSLTCLLLCAGVLGLVAACDDPSGATETEVIHNQLSEEEQSQNWTLLFDGETLDHWRGYRQDDVPAGWRAENGALFFDPSGEEGGDLITQEQYDNFELTLEWRIAEAGNSGIFYLASEEAEAIWHAAPEYQILDNERHSDGANGPRHWSAANYALHAPSPEDVTNPVGEWNEARIVKQGSHVEHWLNGEMVVEYELGSDDWQERVENSKFDDTPEYGQHGAGHIGLQDHGDEVSFRNIKIRLLE